MKLPAERDKPRHLVPGGAGHVWHVNFASLLTMSLPIILGAYYFKAPMKHQIPGRTLGFVLNDVARLLRKRFEQRARATALGLTRAQASVLAYLARQEGLNQAALAQILDVEPITLARLLDRLQSAELVERRPDPKDRRAHLLYLTETAYPLLDRIFALAAEVQQDAMAGISEDQRVLLLDTLLQMKGNLIARASEVERAEVLSNG